MHRKCFKIIPQNAESVKTHCKASNNPLNFSIRKWMIKQQIDVVIVSVTIFENITIERKFLKPFQRYFNHTPLQLKL